MKPLVVVGDSILDIDIEGTADRLCSEAPVPVVEVSRQWQRPGGAGLAATLAARSAWNVVLVTALGSDEPGRRLHELLAADVEVIPLELRGTTVSKTRVRVAGQSMIRLDAGDGRADESASVPELVQVLREAGAVLVSDYGRGVTDHPAIRSALCEAAQRIPLVWDPHPHGTDPVRGATLVTPNSGEAARYLPGDLPEGVRAARLADRWGAASVATTLGAAGAVLSTGNGSDPVAVPVPPSSRIGSSLRPDTCGAGDRFASAATAALLAGASVEQAVRGAVDSAARFVIAGGAAAVSTCATLSDHAGPTRPGHVLDPFELARRVRGTGGRLVATGGCFDLLHRGHVNLLRQARALGDALVVCLRSDESVRRVKGPGRPVVSAPDRARMLRELAYVDAVAVFDEPTPVAILDRLRPHVWVKGNDYAGRRLPEASVVRQHGGDVVFVPVVRGYSTTRLVEAARAQQ